MPIFDPVITTRRQPIPSRRRQSQVLLHDAQNQLRAVHNRQLVVQSFHVGVDRARGDVEFGGHGGFGPVVKCAAHNLQLPNRKLEVARDVFPHLGGEYGGAGSACGGSD